MPAVVGRLQTAGRIDLRHHHLTAKAFAAAATPRRPGRSRSPALFLMQGEVSGLEEGVPCGETDHMAVVQPLFDRQIVPVKDRIARLNIPSRLTPEPVASRPATMFPNSPR